MRKALLLALVRQRPALDLARGVMWPYRALAKRAPRFEALALSDNPSVSRSARLFLALLPFPNQWKWLHLAVKELPKEPEIIELLKHERETIKQKIDKKRADTLKLRNFCQFLKRPDPPWEKGVLRIFALPYLFTLPELLQELDKQYILYVEPPLGIVFRHTWMRVFSTLEDPVLFGIASPEDTSFLGCQPGAVTTQLAHGDFMDTDVKLPLGQTKTHDMVFNGTFDNMERKRHGLMLDLLTHPLLKETTALFLGRGKQSSVAKFHRRVRSMGLEKRVTVVANIRRKRIPEHLAGARIGVHLSLHENACRAVYEYFRSDLPCVVSSSMGGINLSIINRKTGFACRDNELPTVIRRTLDARNRFEPRRWLKENSGSSCSSKILNNRLKSLFAERNYRWNTDIVPLTSSGASRYLKEAHYRQFRPEFLRLKELFDSIPSLPIQISDDSHLFNT